MSQVVSAPAATQVEIDSPPAEKSVSAPRQHDSGAAVADAESKVVIESPLAVVDISNGDPDELALPLLDHHPRHTRSNNYFF